MAVYGGGEGLVVAEGLDVAPDIALVGLVDEAHDDALGMPASVQPCMATVRGRRGVWGI